MRAAAAYARQALLGLASTQLGVPIASLSVASGVVSGGGKTIKYSDLVGGKLFNSSIAKTNPAYDNGDRSVWVRAVGVSRCKPVTVISKVSQQLVPLAFPRDVLAANGFSTNNSGNKVIVDTLGSANQAAQVTVRCQAPLTTTTCKNYTNGVQVSPDTTTVCGPGVTRACGQRRSAAGRWPFLFGR